MHVFTNSRKCPGRVCVADSPAACRKSGFCSPLVDKVWPQLLRVVWAALYACCQLAVELISGLPLRLADPIRLWKLAWLDWHTPSNPASKRPWQYTEVWLLRTSQSRPAQPFLNNPNKDHWGFFLAASLCRFAGVLHSIFSLGLSGTGSPLHCSRCFLVVHREVGCLFQQ